MAEKRLVFKHMIPRFCSMQYLYGCIYISAEILKIYILFNVFSCPNYTWLHEWKGNTNFWYFYKNKIWDFTKSVKKSKHIDLYIISIENIFFFRNGLRTYLCSIVLFWWFNFSRHILCDVLPKCLYSYTPAHTFVRFFF